MDEQLSQIRENISILRASLDDEILTLPYYESLHKTLEIMANLIEYINDKHW